MQGAGLVTFERFLGCAHHQLLRDFYTQGRRLLFGRYGHGHTSFGDKPTLDTHHISTKPAKARRFERCFRKIPLNAHQPRPFRLLRSSLQFNTSAPIHARGYSGFPCATFFEKTNWLSDIHAVRAEPDNQF